MIVATFLINLFTARLLWRFAEVKAHCNTGTCFKYPLDVYVDSVQDTEFAGHVFQNSVTLNPIQCYTWCVKDCRCLSFNYKENNEENYCELNEENHFTNKSNLKPSRGSRYYALRREHQQQVKIIQIYFSSTFQHGLLFSTDFNTTGSVNFVQWGAFFLFAGIFPFEI